MMRYPIFLLFCLPSVGQAQFKNAPTTDQALKEAAQNAPLAWQFDGSTPAELNAWQTKFAGKLRELLGPHQPPKKFEILLENREELDGHTREKLVLIADGHPRLPIYRLLPRPLPKEPCPGVLALHGHGGVFYVVGGPDHQTPEQASRELTNDYGRRFAKRGYIVVAPVMTPFQPRYVSNTTSQQDPCAIAFIRLQLLGKVLMAENLRDCLWGVELLAQDPRVDADRLGCVGLSYGGRMTMLTAALEPRIKVATISGALNVMQERILHRYSCGAQVIPGLLQFGDVPEIGSLIAPRPCVWEVGEQDKLIDPTWARKAEARLAKAYEAAGKKENLIVNRFPGGHNWHGQVAQPLFDRVLLNPKR